MKSRFEAAKEALSAAKLALCRAEAEFDSAYREELRRSFNSEDKPENWLKIYPDGRFPLGIGGA